MDRRGPVAVGVAMLLCACTSSSPGEGDAVRGVATSVPPVATDEPVFSTPTGAVLLLDDGYDGVAALDLDTGVVGRRVVEGQRAGDQPFRLFHAGDALIVGWGEVYAAPLSGDASTLLGDATIAIPAVEPDAVWLARWTGGRIGQGDLSLRLVDTAGRTLVEGAFDVAEGQVLWDVASQSVVGTLAGGHALAATTERIVWCEGSCGSLAVRDVATGSDTAVDLPAAMTGVVDASPANAALSPDRTRLALRAGQRLLVLDVDAASIGAVVAELVPDLTAPRWSPDGRYLLWATWSYGRATTEVGRYDVDGGDVETRRLPFGGSLRPVAIDRADADSFLPAELGSPDDCQPPAVQPSERAGLCGFRATGAAVATPP